MLSVITIGLLIYGKSLNINMLNENANTLTCDVAVTLG